MSARKLMNWLRSWTRSPKNRAPFVYPRARNRQRLTLEPLETRTAPAVLTPSPGGILYESADGEDNRVVLAHTSQFITVDDAPEVLLVRVPPAFNHDLIEKIDVGFAFVLDIQIPIGEFLDLPQTRAVVPAVDLMSVFDLQTINNYINAFVTKINSLVSAQGLAIDIPAFPFDFTNTGITNPPLFDIPAIDLTSLFPDFVPQFFGTSGLFDQFLQSFASPLTPKNATIDLGDKSDTADLSGFDLPATVNGGTGNDTITAGLGNDVLNGDEGDDVFIHNLDATSNDTINGGDGFDTLVIDAGPTSSNVLLDFSGGGGGLKVTINGRSVQYLLNSVEHISVKTGDGPDNITILGTPNLPNGISVDSGGGTDQLTYDVPGGAFHTGSWIDAATGSVDTGVNSAVDFTGIEGLTLSEGASATIAGTDNSDDIQFLGTATNAAEVTVDDHAPITLSAFSSGSSVTLDGLSGDDTFTIDPENATAFSTIQVNGAGPADGDQLVFDGSTAADAYSYTPGTGDEDGTVVVNNSVSVAFTDLDSVFINGQEGNDSLLATDPSSADVAVYTPVIGDGGEFHFGTHAPVSFHSIEDRTVATTGGADTFMLDTANLPGENDTITVSGGGGSAVLNYGGTVTYQYSGSGNRIDLEVHAGDDLVTVTPLSDLEVDVNSSVGNDTLVYNGANPTVNLETGTVSQPGALPVVFTGVETLQVSAGGTLSVDATSLADVVLVSGLGANTGVLTVDNIGAVLPRVIFSGTTALTVDGSGGSDLLVVDGTEGDDIATVTGTAVMIANLVPIAFLEFASLGYNGLDGSDTTMVTPSAQLPINVDGGTPAGATGDRLILSANTTAIFEPGPELDSGGFTIDGDKIVSFDNIEEFQVNDVSGNDLVVTVDGAGGDDHITAVGAGPNNVRFTVDNQKVLDYTGVAEVHVEGLNGQDDIDVDVHVPNLGVTFFVDGGLPVNGDTLAVTGVAGAADNPVWTPNAADGGVFVLSGVTINVAGIEALTYDGESDNEALTVQGQAAADTFVHTPGVTVDDGSVAVDSLLAITYVHLGAGGIVTAAGQGGADTLVAYGTTGTDTFALAFPGTNQADIGLTDGAGVHVALLTTGVESYEIRALAGDDRVHVQAPATIDGTLAVQGGEPDSGSDVFTVDLTGGAFNALIRPNFPNTAAIVTGVGAPITIDGFEEIFFDNTGDSADDTLKVQTGDGDDTARVASADTALGIDAVQSSSLPAILFRALNTFVLDTGGGTNAATFATFGLTGALPGNYQMVSGSSDVLIIEGQDGGGAQADSYTVTNPAGVPSVRVVDNNSFAAGVTVTETGGALARLQLNTLGGDDTVTVDVGSTDVIGVPITYDGGTGSDRLIVTGTPATAVDEVVYAPGPVVGAGRLDYENAANTQLMVIDFLGLEPVLDLVPAATLTVDGTDDDNVITYTQGSVAGRGLVAVDGFEAIEFSNKTALALNGLGGNDTFTVEHPVVTPTGLTTVNVDGGAATGDDFELRGTAGADTVTYTANAATGGQLVVNGTTYNLSFVETASVDALDPGAGDTLTVTTPSATITPGATPGTGTVSPIDLAGHALLPLDFSGFESATVTGTTAVIQGTAGDDTIRISPTGVVEVTDLFGFTNSFDVSAFASLVINALGGDDSTVVESSGLFAGGIRLIGGENGTGSDAVTFNDPNATVNFATNTVTNIVAGPVSLNGVEVVNVNGADGVTDAFTVLGYGASTDVVTLNLNGGDTNNNDNDTIDVTATAGVDTIRYTSLSAATALIERLEGGPVVNVTGFNNADNNLSLRGGGNIDELIDVAPASDDLMQIIQGGLGTRVTVTANGAAGSGVKWVPVDFTGFNALTVDAGAGDDRIDINNSAGLVALPAGIQVDGNTGLDTLRLIGTTTVDSATYTPGPASGEGTVIHTLGSAAQQVFFVNLEPVIDLVAGPLVVNGTGADNAINYTQGPNTGVPGVVNPLNPAGLTTGLVAVDGFAGYEFANKTTLTINGLAGDDTINLNNATTPASLTAIAVDGGDPTASGDTVILNVSGNGSATVTFAYVANTPDAANVTGAGPVPISLAHVGLAELFNPGGGAVALTVLTPPGGQELTFTPGPTFVSGTITGRFSSAPGADMLPLHFADLGILSTVSFTDAGGGRADTLSIDGTSGDDQFDMQGSGQVQIFKANLPGGIVSLPILTPGISALGLFGFDGDDVFNIPGNQPFPSLRIEGGDPSGSDSLVFTGAAGATENVVIAPNSPIPTQQVITGLGAPIVASGVELIRYTGADGDDTLRVDTGPGDDTVRVQGGSARDSVMSSSLPDIEFNGLNTFILDVVTGTDVATFATRDLIGALPSNYHVLTSAADTLIIEGGDAVNDNFTVTHPATGFVAVTDNRPGTPVTVTNDGATAVGRLQLNTLGGDDTVTVDVGSTDVIGVPITYDGGTGSDQLIVTGTPATPVDEVIYTPGPAVGAGRLAYENVANTQLMVIDFLSLEPVLDLVPAATLTVNGTDAPNAITVTPDGANARVAVDGFAGLDFANKTNLAINAQGGSDTVSITPVAPAGLTTITVNGGAPGALDTLVITGTAAAEAFEYRPQGPAQGSVLTTGFARVDFDGVEAVVLDGGSAATNDTLAVRTAAGADQVTLVPGANFDAGTVHVSATAGADSVPALAFRALGQGAVLTLLSGLAGAREDTFVYEGTDSADAFGVTAAGIVTLNSQIAVAANGVRRLRLDGLAGDDAISVAGNHPFAGGILVDGGSPDASDVVTFTGGGAAITVALGAATITETGFGAVTLTGIEHANVLASGAAVTVNGDATDEAITVTHDVGLVTGFQRADQNLLYAVSGLDAAALTLDPQGGSDAVTVLGRAAADAITVTYAATTTIASAGDQTLSLVSASTETLLVNTGEGDDSITLVNTANIPTVIDAGGPTASDTLTYTVNANARTTQGADSTSGTVDQAGGSTVSYSGVEVLSMNSSTQGSTLTVRGTNDNDTIAAGLVGITAVWINDGTVVRYNQNSGNFTGVVVQGLFGADTFSITPHAGVAITVQGGDPTASDTALVNGTAGADAINYRPTATDGGTVQVNGFGLVTLQTVEGLTINGGGGDDALTVTTPAGGHLVTVDDGPLADTGSVALRALSGGDLLGATFSNLGLGGSLVIADAGGVRADTLVLNGRDLANSSELFTVSAAGAIDLFEPTAATPNRLLVTVQTPGVNQLRLNGLAGDDAFNIAGNHPFANGIFVDGGSPDTSDVVTFTGGGAAITVALGAATITETGFGAVTLTGIEHANVLASGAAVTVTGDATDEAITVTHDAGLVTGFQRADQNLVYAVSGLGAAALTLDPQSGSDAVTVLGRAAGDAITVTYAATTSIASAGDQTLSLVSASTETLRVSTGDGDDSITLVNTANIPTVIDAGGPTASDTLTYTVNANARTTQGADSTSGTVDQAGGSTVSYSGVEVLSMNSATVGSTLTVRGTNDNDTIAVGLVGITAVWVNDGTVVRYNQNSGNFTGVVVQGLFGDDTFSITPHAGVAITVQGGDPTASDTALVNGTAGADAINYRPTATDGGTVQVNGFGLVTLQTVEGLTVNGGGGDDALTVTTPAGGHLVTVDDGPLADTGSVNLRALSGGSLLGAAFTNLGINGSLVIADAGAVRADTLVLDGRDLANSSELFTVSAAGAIDLFEPTAATPNRLLVTVQTPGVNQLRLNGLAGDDTFNIAGNHPFANGIFVDGGSPDASDVVTFTGGGAAITVALGTATITETGFGAVTLTGVEHANVLASGAAVTVNGDATDEQITITHDVGLVTGFQRADQNLLYAVSGLGAAALTLDPQGGSDAVTVLGRAAADAITVTYAATTSIASAGDQTLSLVSASTETLRVSTGDGDDSITLVNTANIPTVVDAGGPAASDTLTYTVNANARTTQGADSTSGTIDQAGGSTVSYSGVEVLSMNSSTPGSTLTVRGTNDNDTIAVGLVGITAVWINDGTVVRYNQNSGNFTGVVVQGLFGADTFSITPHAGVAITVQGGDPTASDTALVNGTAAADAINYRPTAVDGGTVQVNGFGLVTLQTVEGLTVNGGGGDDALTVTTPAGGHLVTVDDGPLADTGSVSLRALSGGNLLGAAFTNLGLNGSLVVADAGGVRADTLVLNGRDLANGSVGSPGTELEFAL